MVTNDFKDSKYYELFINNGSNYATYWMSSRCVLADYDIASFRVRIVYSGSVDADRLYHSRDDKLPYAYAFRPIITLNSNVQIDVANSKDGSTSEQAYIIK